MTKQRRHRLAESQLTSKSSQPPSAAKHAQPHSAASQTRSDIVEVQKPTAAVSELARGKRCPVCAEHYPVDFNVCPRDAAELVANDAPESDPLVGLVLDDTYHLTRIIGEGAMGRVYEARHKRLFSKRFAIKVLHADLSRQPDVVSRFLREAEATAVLNHPNIVGVLDVNRGPDGRPYIVAELLEGEQLGDYLARKRKLTVPDAVRIARQLTEALHAAHSKKIVHRDIKPENVFLVGRGERRTVKVLDFGISRLGTASGTLTKFGTVMGTPAYMPPEQARGQHVDHRADVYAVGAILYEAVTGKRAFDGDDPIATLSAVLTADPPRPRTLDPSLPPMLELIIEHAMAKKPAERYASMREFDAALAQFEVADSQPSGERKSLNPLPREGATQTLLHWSHLWHSEAPLAETVRTRLLAATLSSFAYLWALLIDAGTGAIRWSRAGTPLAATEIVLVVLGSAGLLLAPGIVWTRYVVDRVWPSTPRSIDVLSKVQRVLLTSLAAYGAGALTVRVSTSALHSATSGAGSPSWSVLAFAAAVGAGFVGWWTGKPRKPRS
jgi:serine/threonine protein kinase